MFEVDIEPLKVMELAVIDPPEEIFSEDIEDNISSDNHVVECLQRCTLFPRY